MPYKYPKAKDWHVPKQKYKITNWPEYNKSLKNRVNIDFWLTDDAVIRRQLALPVTTTRIAGMC